MNENDFQILGERPVRVLFTGGGSGGPTLPLLALAEETSQQRKVTHFLFLGRDLFFCIQSFNSNSFLIYFY